MLLVCQCIGKKLFSHKVAKQHKQNIFFTYLYFQSLKCPFLSVLFKFWRKASLFIIFSMSLIPSAQYTFLLIDYRCTQYYFKHFKVLQQKSNRMCSNKYLLQVLQD